MKFNVSNVEFSKFDIKRNVTIPSKLTKDLAYFIGIHVGDGCLSVVKRKNNKSIDYNIGYFGHEIDENEFHKKYILILIKKLFNIDSYVREGHKTTIELRFRSKAVTTFLNKTIGLPIGSKKNVDIPKLIKKSSIIMKKAFLKGLADTEFCLTFKKRYREKHYYPAIKFAIQSEKLKNSVLGLIKELGFSLCSLTNYMGYRDGKKTFINTIDLNGVDNLNKWMKLINFNSTKHLTKYQVWNRFGFCPPHTNIIERRKILKGEIDIKSYYGPVA